MNFVSLLKSLPHLKTLPHEGVLFLIASHKVDGLGIGWVASHLLASTLDTRLRIWSFDRSLEKVAKGLSLSFGG